ncbi:MAG: class I SAM-dependent methyltransferase [Anaerolineaceae bacterium]
MNVDQKVGIQFNYGTPGSTTVAEYFDAESQGWNNIYHQQDVFSIIHQERRTTALRFFDELNLPFDARILEIGCGAGLTTTDIARRGYRVTAVDTSQAMVELARENAQKSNLDSLVSFHQADIYDLKYEEHSFDLVIALGVIPWLPDLSLALERITRLVRNGGYLLVNMDNRRRLNHLLNPLQNPLLENVKKEMKDWFERMGIKKPSSTPAVRMYTVQEFENFLAKNNLEVIENRMLGFGPFQFFRFNLLSDPAGVRVHRYLQNLADRGHPFFRLTGSQYLILARINPDH